MGKYDALGTFLRRWTLRNDADTVELTFADIERIISGLLPNSAESLEWWRNEATNERGFGQSRSWLDAGFEAEPVEGRERVRFYRRTGGL